MEPRSAPSISYSAVSMPTIPSSPFFLTRNFIIRLGRSPRFKVKPETPTSPDVLVQMDDYAGRLLDAIDQMGVRDTTIFIFTSDNGPEMFEPYYGFSGPWRGTLLHGHGGLTPSTVAYALAGPHSTWDGQQRDYP